MKTMQKGFTLIELMIVVAIIGILAAVAVPAYQDYTIKSKISEAASMASVVRTAIDVNYSEGVDYTTSTALDNTSLGLLAAASYNAKYVSAVDSLNDNTGTVRVYLRNDPDLGLKTAAGGSVDYIPSAKGGNLQWTPTCSWGPKWCPKG